ncbi:hypothetical protein ND748_02860 [Frankia sp. AiPs1]|uniref:hypothetical protein n=1 Tax=Frankia sp. AiPs1 TaxID=573493 RepID=UPI0020444F86|nr:hypothetical protein [Frankia sp. AiPs1]MCM3920621.1 hypothetical protein [Frankia sp. AiPs1]
MDFITGSWWAFGISLLASFAAGSLIAVAQYAITDRVPFLRIHLREAVSYRLHLLLIVVLSRLLRLEVAREIRKDSRRRSR